jgi:serine/threonine-protein kinase
VDPLRWKRISELFAAARQLDGERRIAFLQENCGQDEDLFQQVKCLLDIDGQHGLLDSKPTASMLGVSQLVAGRFRIIRYIAEGGMGTVYEAEDLQLRDHVALKAIRPDIACDPTAGERFRREILLGKKVTHPNVCRIHDLGIHVTQNGTEVLFLTMQFLRGETLSSRIKRGPIPQTEALPLIEDMADALTTAHQAEVIHRDFKSGNVMLVPGAHRTCAVVTDFGLARGIRDGASLTQSGLVGTVDYMAPEQITGGEITPATDIYALGVVMYEMVTGKRPFIGDSKGSVIQKHLNDEPQPPRELAPHLDANWNEAILGCLRKPPGERFQSAAEVKAAVAQDGDKLGERLPIPRRKRATSVRLIALSVAFSLALLILGAIPAVRLKLREWFPFGSVALGGSRGNGVSSHPIRSLAVVPFIDASSHSSQDYLADGMTEELTTQLTQISALRVISHTSVMKYKDLKEPISGISRELNVDAIIEGTVYRVDHRIRITVELVDVTGKQNLWSHSYERNLDDVFALQSELARAIVSEIRLRLTPREQERLATRQTSVPADAYENYLQGRYHLNRRTAPELSAAVENFQAAVARDENFAEAYAGLADAYTLLGLYRALPANHAFSLAQTAARRALEIDPQLGQAHASIAFVRFLDLDWADVEDQFKAAIDSNPGYAVAHHWYALYLAAQGRPTEALREINLAVALDPNSSIIRSNVAWCMFLARRYDEAIQKAKDAVARDPSFPVAHEYLGQAYLEKRQYNEAISELAIAVELAGRTPYYIAELANAYASAGLPDSARSLLLELQSKAGGLNVSLADLALVHVGLGENSRAIELLEQAVRVHSPGAVNLKVHPRYDPLRSDPHFAALVRRLGNEARSRSGGAVTASAGRPKGPSGLAPIPAK